MLILKTSELNIWNNFTFFFCLALNNFMQMKCCILLALLGTSFFTGHAQVSGSFIDSKIQSISPQHAVSTASIASYINNSFSSETDKVRAAYTWVIRNIKYDTDSMYAINWNMSGSLKITESFRRRKGVCENFAGIFIDIITRAGLTGVTIDGYTKQANVVHKTGHTWAAAVVDGTWYLFDPTWDKDRLQDYHYFMVQPAAFESHMPFDPLWQFTENPISHRQFQSRGAGKVKALLEHADSIKAFMRMGELSKLEATARRMVQADKITDLIKNKIAFLHMQIATINEERDMHLYNTAVANLNQATTAYNTYIHNVNKQASLDDTTDYNLLLESAILLIQNAFIKIADIGKYIPNYQYDPASLKIRLQQIADKIQAQKEILHKISKK